MSKGISGLFNVTLGTTRTNSSKSDTSYSDRGIEIPEHIKQTLSCLKKKCDTVSGGTLDFHSHPHDNDCVPSRADREMVKK